MASLETLSANSYRVVWRQDGAKQRETFDNQAAAEDFKAAVERAGNRWPRYWIPGRGDEREDATSAPLFRDWAPRAIAARATANERTRHDYLRDAERHLYPRFGDTPIDRIAREKVGLWLVDLQRAGISAKTIKNLQGLASSVMVDAIEAGHATVNPFRGALRSLPAVKQEEMVFLTRQEFETLHRAVAEPWRPLVLTLFMTGLRWSEATALRVRDVDLLARKLNVVRAWKRTPESYMVIGEPKSRRSRRTITISRRVADALIPFIVDRDPDALLFTSSTGRPVSHSNFRFRVWVPALRTIAACDTHRTDKTRQPCNCPGMVAKWPRIHDSRHSHASWLVDDGASLVAIQRRLGTSRSKPRSTGTAT